MNRCVRALIVAMVMPVQLIVACQGSVIFIRSNAMMEILARVKWGKTFVILRQGSVYFRSGGIVMTEMSAQNLIHAMDLCVEVHRFVAASRVKAASRTTIRSWRSIRCSS